MIIDEKKLNKPQQVIFEAIKKLEKGEILVIRQPCNGRRITEYMLKECLQVCYIAIKDIE